MKIASPQLNSYLLFLAVFVCAMSVNMWILVKPADSWPAASLEGRQANCLGCHTNTGPWTDEGMLIIDIIDAKTGESFKQDDGSFVIPVKGGLERRVRTVFGVKPEVQFPPDMVGWLYVDPEELRSAPEASIKFARGWNVNRSFCGKRLVEKVQGFEGDKLAQITMTVSQGENATDRQVQRQVLFKSLARGLEANYYEKKVLFKVE